MSDARNPNAETAADGGPTERNISTEHQPAGAARNPSDTLDRAQSNAPDSAKGKRIDRPGD